MNESWNSPEAREARASFVYGLDLDVESPAQQGNSVLSRSRRSLVLDARNEEASVVSNTILAFVAGMSRENKDAVKKTVLLAILVADKAFGGERGSESWFNKFYGTMNALGWVPERYDHARYRMHDKRFTVEQVGLTVLASAIATIAGVGPVAAMLLKVAKDAIEVLPRSDAPLELFKRETRDYEKGSYCLGSCIESQGEVSLALGAVRFSTRLGTTDLLFTEWHNSEINIVRGEAAWFLDQEEYLFHRDAIVGRLRDKAKNDISNYQI